MNLKRHVSICFLILHYMDGELTNKTIESVLNLNNFGNSQIVVVDNASPNGSGKLLKEKYMGMKEIHIILSESNVGFSAGNNIGFQYIKNNFISDFIIAINNDILFPQIDFIDKLNALYAEEPFWVAGPDVYVPHRYYHSSPMHDHPVKDQEVRIFVARGEWEKRQLTKKFSLYVFKIYLRDCFGENILIRSLIKIKRFIKGQEVNYIKRNEGIVLQGSCLIFDKRYCEKNNNLFLPLTFMYGEEMLLTLRCIKNNWEIRYFPELLVWHMCNGSSKLAKLGYREYCKKRMIILERCQEVNRIYMAQITVGNED